jgi:hypothetical protein
MAKYFLTNKAVEDLSNIWDYTYEVWSESQAGKYYKLFIGFCKEISVYNSSTTYGTSFPLPVTFVAVNQRAAVFQLFVF